MSPVATGAGRPSGPGKIAPSCLRARRREAGAESQYQERSGYTQLGRPAGKDRLIPGLNHSALITASTDPGVHAASHLRGSKPSGDRRHYPKCSIISSFDRISMIALFRSIQFIFHAIHLWIFWAERIVVRLIPSPLNMSAFE